MVKRKSIREEMMQAFTDFDYPSYYKAKAKIKKMTPELKSLISRLESHPTFGKTETDHNKWAKKRVVVRESKYEREMMRDAIARKHHKHASVFFGETHYDGDYKKICKKLGIKL